MGENKLKKFRESRLISESELARKAKVSSITIPRIENGLSCQRTTMRKVLLALGLRIF